MSTHDPLGAGRIETRELEEEMRSSFLDYAMSVIVSRALPDVRDGLKPVHRRVLFAMNELGLQPGRPRIKCARVVGDTMGKYHPHGNQAIYDALVRMAQPFSLRYPLVDPQGNFGNVDGYPAAAERYTECRLSAMAMELLRDIGDDTIDYEPNYDGTAQQPTVLPARFPNLLVNGSSGIAVGMATNMPPHNLGEVVDAIVTLIDDPTADVDRLSRHLKGPDFPTGGIILGREGIREAYRSGRGRILVRARAHVEELRGGKSAIIVTELPYGVKKGGDDGVIYKIAGLVRDGVITEIPNPSRGEGPVGQVRHADPDRAQARRDPAGRPQQALQAHGAADDVRLQRRRARRRRPAHAVAARARPPLPRPPARGRHAAAQVRAAQRGAPRARPRRPPDRAGQPRRGDRDDPRRRRRPTSARESLIEKFSLSEIQAQAILDMRLRALTGLERKRLSDEYADLQERIGELREILGDEKRIDGVIREELVELKERFGKNDDRRTEIAAGEGSLELEDMIAEEDMVIAITRSGYIKRLPVTTYREQRRGGIGVMGMDMKDDDYIEHLFVASTHDYILFFTTVGKVYRLKVHELPLGSRQSKGRAIVNLLPLRQDELIRAVIATRNFEEAKYLVFATKKGIVKKTGFLEYNTPLKADGIIALKMREDDELIGVRLSDGEDDILMVSRMGQAVRFSEKDVRSMGRPASGVAGMKLRAGDEVIEVDIASDDADLLVVTENGWGKRTRVAEYPVKGRGTMGVKTAQLVEGKGRLAGARIVRDGYQVMLISDGGTVIRTAVDGIKRSGRATQGVIVMRLREGEKVSSLAPVIGADEEGEPEALATATDPAVEASPDPDVSD